MSPVFFANQWSVADSRRILFVGSLAKRKGLATLLEALALVRAQLPDACLDAIGGYDGQVPNDLFRVGPLLLVMRMAEKIEQHPAHVDAKSSTSLPQAANIS